MAKVTIKGIDYPVSVTFGAIASYLESVGEDSSEGMANFSKLPPSRYPHFIAACVNDGLRKEGREERISVETVADCDFIEVSSAVTVIFSLMVPQTSEEKKKD
ncbi:MAG: hypothetical protein IK076_07925 [Bacteroidales bacterium]|nr:hypothetical protein [Bacteroidales bacterium]